MNKDAQSPVFWKLEEYAFGAVALREEIKRQKRENNLLRNPIKVIWIRLLYGYMVVATFMLTIRQTLVQKKQDMDKQNDEDIKDELVHACDEEEEHSIEICCPKCGETRITTPNTGITCKGCGVRIVVGEDGEIRRVI